MSAAAAAEQATSGGSSSSSQLQLGREAPVWVPDTASVGCQACDRKFSLIVRRHHCRCCGRLLCSSCSNFFVPLPYLDWQVARVCQVCDQALNKPSASNRQRTGEHRRSNSLSSLTTKEQRHFLGKISFIWKEEQLLATYNQILQNKLMNILSIC